MESVIKWQTGKPERNGLYLVTMATGGVTVKEFYNSYTSSCSWWEDVEDYEEVVAWCDFKDIEPYKEKTDGTILHLPLNKEWYEMIESGVKTEEYREIKPYWIKRFFAHADGRRLNNSDAGYLAHNISALYEGTINRINYTHVKFSYGYTKRTMTFEIKSITIGKGKPEWGAPTEDVFIIKLGEQEA